MQQNHFNPKIVGLVFIVLWVLPLSLSLAAQLTLERPKLPSGPDLNQPFDMQAIAYQPSSREQYFQTWNAYWKTDSGFHVFANFVVTNVGFGDNTCGLNMAIVRPDGSSEVETLQLKGKHFTGRTDTFFIQCGQAQWVGDKDSLQIHATLKRLAIDMVVSRTAPGFGPPMLYIEPSHQDEVLYNIPHINSIGSGKIRIDDTWHTLKGRVIVEHLRQNIPLYDYSRVWHRIRILDGDRSLIIGGFEPNDDLTEGYTLLVLTEGNKILHVSDRAVLKATAFEEDPESGYPVPTTFTVSLQDPDLQLDATIQRYRPVNRIDVLEQLNWLLRVIVRTFFTNPWLYRHEVDVDISYHLNGQPGAINGRAMQEVIFVND